jgi:Ca2+-binding RTX toxin-like protein
MLGAGGAPSVAPMTSRHLLAVACSLLGAATLTTTSASAATIARTGDGGVTYVAGAGAEDLLVDLGPSSARITDEGAAAELPPGCERRGDDAVCEATSLRVELGDGSDRLVVTSVDRGVPLTVDGGDGDDHLQGGGGGDTLIGGPGDDALDGLLGDDLLDGGQGDDEIAGGAGGDRLLGGDGDDEITGDGANPPAADVVDGGAGSDRFTDYGRRTGDEGPIVLTLSGGDDDGFPGEHDDVRGVETLSITSPGRIVGSDVGEAIYGIASSEDQFVIEGRGGDDELRTPGGRDRLDGGPGADTLIAGFGNDRITAGPGRDRVFGDTAPGYCDVFECTLALGNDRIDVRDGERDIVTCGPGRDVVRADRADRVASDCEAVKRGAAGARSLEAR